MVATSRSSNSYSADIAKIDDGSFGGDHEEEQLNQSQEESPTHNRNEGELATITLPNPVTLSKSWSAQKVHEAIFTGGKIVHCHGQGLGHTTSTTTAVVVPQEYPPKSNPPPFQHAGQDGQLDTLRSSFNPFLLLPVRGDVAIVDLASGIRLGTVRGASNENSPQQTSLSRRTDTTTGGDVDEDMDDSGIDAEAITAFALSWNDQVILTCARNSLLKQYAVAPVYDFSRKNKSEMLPMVLTSPISFVKTWTKSGHTLPVVEMVFHPSNVFVATGSVDGTVRVWDVRGAFPTHVFRPLAQGFTGGGSGTLVVTALQWLPDTERLHIAIGRDDGSVIIHDLLDKSQTGAVVLRDHVSSVTCMEWHLESKIFITAGRDSVINLWNMQANHPLSKTKKRKSTTFVSTTYEKVHTHPVYEQVEGMLILAPRSPRGGIVLATAGSKGRIRLWQITPPKENVLPRIEPQPLVEQPLLQAFGDARGGYLGLCYSPFGRNMSNNADDATCEHIVVSDSNHNISFLKVRGRTEEILTVASTIVGYNDDILDVRLIHSTGGSKAGKAAVITNSAEVRVFDLADFSCVMLRGHSAIVLCVDVSPCYRFIATCGKDKQVRIWHLATNKCVAVGSGHTEALGSTALSRKAGRYEVTGKSALNGGGSFVVTVSMDRTLKRWNLPGAAAMDASAELGQETQLTTFANTRAHEKDINIVTVAPNDSLIATGSQDKTVKLWQPTNLSLVATLIGHRRGVWDCQFSPYDRVLATGSGDRTIKVWSLSDFSCVRSFQGHLSSVLRVRFLCGGLQMLSAGADGLLKLWTIRTSACEATMDRHNDKVWALDVSLDGSTVVTGGADSQLVMWEDTTKQVEESKRQEEEEAILLDQSLSNHLRHKEYTEALKIALARDKPEHTLKILSAIIERDIQNGVIGVSSIREYAERWSTDDLLRILRYCREWNTRAINCQVALITLNSIVATVPADKLAAIDGVPEILAGITPYAERHFHRLDGLHAGSYLLDFVLCAMGTIDDEQDDAGVKSWESSRRLVLPPKELDGRIQLGGRAIVGRYEPRTAPGDESDVATLGESGSEDE